MPTTDGPALAHVRSLRTVVEAFHAILYFAPEVQARWEARGIEPRAEGYIATRAPVLGAASAQLCAATFFNYNPAYFHRHLPGLWDKASPAELLAERAAGLQELFERVDAPTDGLDEITELATAASGAVSMAGRPLAAGNQAVELPDEPFARAWQAVAVLREHRGDGHIAVLLANGLGPVEALALMAGWEHGLSRRFLQQTRMWPDDDWDGAVAGLVDRGLLDPDGTQTAAGADLRETIELDTDRLAAAPYRAIGMDGVRRLFDRLRAMGEALNEGDAYPRPMTLPDALPGATVGTGDSGHGNGVG